MLRSSLWAYLMLVQTGALLAAGPMPDVETRNSPVASPRADSGSTLAGPLRELLLRNMPDLAVELCDGEALPLVLAFAERHR